MKVKILKDFVNSLTEEQLEKELTFHDFQTGKTYFFGEKERIDVVDLDDEDYIDLVFNIN